MAERGHRYRRTLQHGVGIGAAQHVTGTDVSAQAHNVARAIDERDVERIAHAPRMNRPARGKAHDRVPVGRHTHSHPQQPIHETTGDHDVDLFPTQRAGGERSRPPPIRTGRPHSTTPGLHGSITTLRTCSKCAGAPRFTPAMDRPLGHGAYRIVQR